MGRAWARFWRWVTYRRILGDMRWECTAGDDNYGTSPAQRARLRELARRRAGYDGTRIAARIRRWITYQQTLNTLRNTRPDDGYNVSPAHLETFREQARRETGHGRRPG